VGRLLWRKWSPGPQLGGVCPGVANDGVVLGVQLAADEPAPPLPAARSRLLRAGPASAMTSQGTAHGRFTRALQTHNLSAAETAMRELGQLSLADALDYLGLLATAGRTGLTGPR
jgi:hypothetical protein